MEITLESIKLANDTLAGNIVKTPEIESKFLSDLIRGSAYLKLENLQYTSSFKARGAYVSITRVDRRAKESWRYSNVSWKSCTGSSVVG